MIFRKAHCVKVVTSSELFRVFFPCCFSPKWTIATFFHLGAERNVPKTAACVFPVLCAHLSITSSSGSTLCRSCPPRKLAFLLNFVFLEFAALHPLVSDAKDYFFVSASVAAIWDALKSCNIDHDYTSLLNKIYRDQKSICTD